MKIKAFILICIIIFCMFSLTGCYDADGIENLGYVVAMGLDKGDSNKLRLSLQFALLNNNSSDGSSSQSSSSTVTEVDCASIESGISLINSYISKKVNLAHCKAIVISEELAYEGIAEYIYTLINNVEIRPDCNIIISRCNANEYLENANPTLETLTARYYESTLNSSEYTGYIQNINLEDFFSNMVSSTGEAYAILGSVNVSSANNGNNNMFLYNADSSYKAGETPITAENSIENMGIAVFKDDKLVGELNGIDSLCHLIVTNRLKSATISIPNPYNSSSTMDLYISNSKETKTSTKLINSTPYIKYEVFLEVNVVSLDENFDATNNDNIKIINEYANSYLEQNILSYLYKTSKEYKSDISNAGKFFVKNYLSWDDWLKSDWDSNYTNAFFDVNVNTNIESSQLFTKI